MLRAPGASWGHPCPISLFFRRLILIVLFLKRFDTHGLQHLEFVCRKRLPETATSDSDEQQRGRMDFLNLFLML